VVREGACREFDIGVERFGFRFPLRATSKHAE
jgi:hypothetical protein